jgi:hypothetical protein
MALTVIVSMPRGSFMPHLILVKHALPAIIPTLPANQWHLSEGGRAQCALLADQLATYVPDTLVSSVSSLPILEKGEQFLRVIGILALLCSHYKIS